MMMKRILKQLDDHTEEYLIGILLVAMTLVMFLQIVMRYVFNAALSWPEEFCRYAFVYITFLTIGYCVQRNSMLRLDLVIQALPKVAARILEFLIWVCCLAFFAYMLVYSVELIKLTRESARVSPAMGIPYYLLYASTAIGFGLGVIRNVQYLIKLIRNMAKGEDKKETAA